jgi:hypothetical protein
MNIHEENKRKIYIAKLVSNARAILTNQIEFTLGVLKMQKIMYWINRIEPLTEVDLQIFLEFNKKTVVFAIGNERKFWQKEALEMQDKALDILILKYKDGIFDKCFEIVNKYGNGKL